MERREWRKVKVFEVDGVVARVSRLDLPGCPRYSYQLGRHDKEDRFIPSISPAVDAKHYVGHVSSQQEAVVSLVDQVEGFIREDLQYHLDLEQARKAAAELRATPKVGDGRNVGQGLSKQPRSTTGATR